MVSAVLGVVCMGRPCKKGEGAGRGVSLAALAMGGLPQATHAPAPARLRGACYGYRIRVYPCNCVSSSGLFPPQTLYFFLRCAVICRGRLPLLLPLP